MHTDERLRQLLAVKNLKQKEFAKKIGVTESIMSFYLNGDKQPKGYVLKRMAKELNVSVDYLLGADEVGFSTAQIKEFITVNKSKFTDEERLELIRLLVK